MSKSPLKPQQARSRDTEARLFRATSRVLEEHGLEGATIPRIARAAGVAAGTVYRRYRDKDALLRAVFLGRLETAAMMQSQMPAIAQDWIGTRSLEGALETIIGSLVSGYRMRRGLVRATHLYLETRADDSFRRRAAEADASHRRALFEILLRHRHRIGHPDPERALAFALQQLGSTLMNVLALESTGSWLKLYPMTDEELKKELTRSLLAYLQVE